MDTLILVIMNMLILGLTLGSVYKQGIERGRYEGAAGVRSLMSSAFKSYKELQECETQQGTLRPDATGSEARWISH